MVVVGDTERVFDSDGQAGVFVVNGSTRLAFAGGLAAMVGGLFWALKAACLMIARFQPPVVYEVAPVFFPIAVIGLYGSLDGNRSRLARSGLTSAGIAELCALVSVLGLFLGPAEWTPTGDTVTVLTPFITLSALGSILGLLLVGIVVRRTASLPGGWKNFPMSVAISIIPLIASSALMKDINERLFELPTLIIGLEWMVLGAVMVRRLPSFARTPASARPGRAPRPG
ncbi:hypothetical protein N865_08570 [Intrasporangium oryzae NRRL B-24470]|uniref:DUF998 domain-containing protein n=1 Tax=Intrasporangium oryzae NRRL B-24470 TaxID=1386089 RepID=W9G5S7_9MICO|nr:hypothetical protein [Intrasporangium oryzae]EWT01390.1 hypothetical protein N865_08570 [Intrasporangium oryzae NRRL B-24470]